MTHARTKDKVTFGFWVYIMSDCVLFASLFATYAVLQGQTFGGASIDSITNLRYVFAETMLLLTSSFTMGLALLAAHANKVRLTQIALAVTLVLGLGFLAMEINEFMHLLHEGQGPDKSAFLSAFFTLLGTHGLHVAIASLWMVVMMTHVAYRGLVPSTQTKLMCLGLFWHFLDIVWIFIFTFVYLFGYL